MLQVVEFALPHPGWNRWVTPFHPKVGSLRCLALALTLVGLADSAVPGQRKKAKGSRRTTPNKPLAFTLYPLTYLGAQRFHKHPSGTGASTKLKKLHRCVSFKPIDPCVIVMDLTGE